MSEGIDKGEGHKGLAKLLAGRISCIVGILFGAGGILFALLGASANVSAGAVGAALGILGYFLGARRLGAATIVLGVVAVFFMAAASTGLIPASHPWVTGTISKARIGNLGCSPEEKNYLYAWHELPRTL